MARTNATSLTHLLSKWVTLFALTQNLLPENEKGLGLHVLTLYCALLVLMTSPSALVKSQALKFLEIQRLQTTYGTSHDALNISFISFFMHLYETTSFSLSAVFNVLKLPT